MAIKMGDVSPGFGKRGHKFHDRTARVGQQVQNGFKMLVLINCIGLIVHSPFIDYVWLLYTSNTVSI